MKVVAFNGSPRKGGNTETMIRKVFEALAGRAGEFRPLRGPDAFS